MSINVWRVGSKWDNKSQLKIFDEYKVVYFGSDSDKIGDYKSARQEDLLAISDCNSYNIIAFAVIKEAFAKLTSESYYLLWKNHPEIRKTIDTNRPVIFCKVEEIVHLGKNNQFQLIIRNRFSKVIK